MSPDSTREVEAPVRDEHRDAPAGTSPFPGDDETGPSRPPYAAEHDRVLWQLAVDAAGVGVFDWDLATGELRWDDRLLHLFGHTRDSFGGTIEAFDESVHPDDRDRVSQALAEAIETCGSYAAEYRVVRPDGEVRWVSARGQALGDDDGTAVRVVGAAYDTTAVQDGEARVARVLESMPTAFFHLDADWRFTYANTEAERLLGPIGGGIVGSVIWELFPSAVGSTFETHYRRAAETGHPVEFEAYYPPPLDDWYEVRAWPTPGGLSVYFLKVTDRRHAEEQVARIARRSALLAEVTRALTDTLDVEEAVARLSQLVVPVLGDWCVVTLVDGGGPASGSAWRHRLRDIGSWHHDPDARPRVARYAELRVGALTDTSFVAEALDGNRTVLVTERATEAIARVLAPGEAQDLFRALAPSAAAVVPLRGRGRISGLLTVFRGPGAEPFAADDLDMLDDVAGRAGLALDNARAYAEQRDLAEALQRSLMTEPPQPARLRIAVRYEPATDVAQVGGDWYDAFLQPDGATSIVIGDVVGHDTAAAAAMGQVRTLLRGIAVTTGDGPAGVLRRVDEAMRTLQVSTTATAVVARLEQIAPDRYQLRWSNAGHPPPLVAMPGPGGAVAVRALWPEQANLLLGLHPETDRSEDTVVLPDGATVLLYTDGLVERRGQPLDEGIEALRAVLGELVRTGLDLEELGDELLRRLQPARPEDDVALVVLRIGGC
jgi:PAS domain S-box-containing protein